MKISNSEFLEKYKQLFLDGTLGTNFLAFWKMKWFIENGETFYLPEYDCWYMIRDNHLLVYYSPDNQIHLSIYELNALDCISLPAALYDSIKDRLIGFNAQYEWSLRYDFSYIPKTQSSLYEAIDFDFSNEQHYQLAASMINNGNDDYDWSYNGSNIKKMTKYSVFDPTLWFFVKDKGTQDLAAVVISAFDKEMRQTNIDWVAVFSAYQGKGVGRFMIEETIRRCKDKSDTIVLGAGSEEDFYRKCGFVNHEEWVWAPKDGYKFKAAGIQP
ncbi:MAG: GNAT family N-acetyltransferase [Oscillospiraceae bacterium]|nr:GNAT family N-acetyltransferase [Oscillospiraceae bacterium]